MLLAAGDLVLDVLVRPHGPVERGTDTPGTVSVAGGGSASNVACWVAFLGGVARFVGAVGDDPAGAWLLEDLRRRGVDARVEVRPEEQTGAVAVWIEGEERTMVTCQGANRTLPAFLLAQETWEGVVHFHFTGYALVTDRQQVQAAKALARQRGCTVSLDPAAHPLVLEAVGLEGFRSACEEVDVLLPNRAEALALSGAQTLEEAAEALASLVPVVCIKDGAQGCLVATRRGLLRVPTEPATVVDPTGAGDAFAAGFLLRWTQGARVEEAARAGNQAGSEAIRHLGARPPLPGVPGRVS